MRNKILKTLGITLGAISLASSVFAHEACAEVKSPHCHQEKSEATIKVEVLPQSQIQRDQRITTRIKLTSIKENKAILLKDLKEVHTQEIHVLIFDQTLTDYQHVHPTPTKEPGIYEFSWAPKNEGTYKLWADIVPLNTGKEEYISTIFATVGNHRPSAKKDLNLNEKIGDNLYFLTFETKELKKGKATMGQIKVLDKEGKGVQNLEPIMGAFAHIVAINEDFTTIAHVHPMGKEPTDARERGGPELKFHFMPKKSGYYKIWMQVQRDGKSVFIPFGIKVE